jgi:hypothetical protein
MRLCAETTTEIAAQDAMMRLAIEYEMMARKLEQGDENGSGPYRG